jgi:hypothetical protein
MSRIQRIEINFPVPVEFPDGFEQALSALIGMICEKYERENPTKVMWTAGHGNKPIWNEPKEPEFDDSVYCIDVAEREDTGGSNRYNPDREILREDLRKRLQEKRKRKGKNAM